MTKRTLSEKQHFEQILASSEFKKSATYKNLLKFVYDESKKGRRLSENIIAYEVFGRDKNFNPSEDTIVRVYFHELRKKLDIYYKTEGIHDKQKLSIPKGSYNIVFDNKPNILSLATVRLIFALLFALLLLSLALNIIQFKTHKSYTALLQKVPASNLIWTDFLNDDKPILIVIGDVFFFRDSCLIDGKQYQRIIRGSDVESFRDYRVRYKGHPSYLQDPIPPFTYLIEYGAWGLVDLLPLLYAHQKEYELRLSSQLTPQDLRDYNLISFGYLKSQNVLFSYFEHSNFEYNRDKRAIIHSTTDGQDQQVYSPVGVSVRGTHDDYAFFAKIPGPNNNHILMLNAFAMTGVLEILENFHDLEFLNQLESQLIEKYGVVPQHFEGLTHVYGINRKAIESNILILNKIDDNVKFWTKMN